MAGSASDRGAVHIYRNPDRKCYRPFPDCSASRTEKAEEAETNSFPEERVLCSCSAGIQSCRIASSQLVYSRSDAFSEAALLCELPECRCYSRCCSSAAHGFPGGNQQTNQGNALGGSHNSPLNEQSGQAVPSGTQADGDRNYACSYSGNNRIRSGSQSITSWPSQ